MKDAAKITRSYNVVRTLAGTKDVCRNLDGGDFARLLAANMFKPSFE
jgi:hypothetical protein